MDRRVGKNMLTQRMATLVSPKDFSPVEDAENIKKACQGWGTDEKAIISIVGHRNLFQRRLLRLAYEEIYHEDLINQLKSELSGHLERAICQWILDPADRDALYVDSTLKGSVPDHRVIMEIACLRSAEDLLAIKRAYKFRFKRSIEEDVSSLTKGNIRKVLVALMTAYRYDGHETDEELANSEAGILHDEIMGNAFGHDELIRIVSTRSKAQLSLTFNRYRDIHGTSITKGLRGDTENEYLAALRTAIRCIKDPRKYLVKVLRNAMGKTGRDEDAIGRVIITRAERDLKEIDELFLHRNNMTITEAVSENTSGDYRSFLLALLGNDDI